MRTAVKFKRESFTPHLAGRDVCYTVFTVPLHLRSAAAHFPTWARWTKALLKALEAQLGFVWGYLRADPAGKCREAEISGQYCDCSHCSTWHPHLNLLWVRKEGKGELAQAQLWLMKTIWAEIIGAEIAWDGDYVKPIVSVHHQWAPDPSTVDGTAKKLADGRLWNWYLYQGRKWPAWQAAAKKFLRIRPVGKFPAKALTEEKAETKLRRLYQQLEESREKGNDVKAQAKIQRKIDKLRNPSLCRCGCGVIRRPEPEPLCRCGCGEKVRCMPVLDEEEAAHWIAAGPEAIRAEIRRRRRVGDKNGREPFESDLVAAWRESPPELFGGAW